MTWLWGGRETIPSFLHFSIHTPSFSLSWSVECAICQLWERETDGYSGVESMKMLIYVIQWIRRAWYVHCIHHLPYSLQNPTMAQLLASPLLGKSELVFLNVPRMGLNQTQIIRQLISHHVRPNITILDITITNRRWWDYGRKSKDNSHLRILKFAKKEDAVEVMTKMDNVKYRGKPLVVRINNNECNDKV